MGVIVGVMEAPVIGDADVVVRSKGVAELRPGADLTGSDADAVRPTAQGSVVAEVQFEPDTRPGGPLPVLSVGVRTGFKRFDVPDPIKSFVLEPRMTVGVLGMPAVRDPRAIVGFCAIAAGIETPFAWIDGERRAALVPIVDTRAGIAFAVGAQRVRLGVDMEAGLRNDAFYAYRRGTPDTVQRWEFRPGQITAGVTIGLERGVGRQSEWPE